MLALEMKSETRLHSCCFTGHRPEKLKLSEQEIIAALEREIHTAIDDGFVEFISGMSRGVDIWAAEIILKLKKEGQPLRLISAVPFEGFERRMPAEWKKRYHDILAAADQVEYISPAYSPASFQLRNEWMVDRSSRVIAVFNGEKGGTKNTIDYAARKGVRVVNAI